MKHIAFFSRDRLCRLMVSLLLCMGLMLPLLFTFGAESSLWTAVSTAVLLTLSFTLLGSFRRGRLLLLIALAAASAVQFLFPNMGFFGSAYEGIKAIALYFKSVPGAAVLYSRDVALLLSVSLAVISYAFSGRTVGFLPATICLVLMLYGMWSLGKGEYLWYTAPAFIALLMIVSQTSHEKGNLFEVLPMATLVVVLAMLLLPAGQMVIDPLYDAAMDLKQTIEDYLFFTEPRNVFTLGTYGYYPMGSGRLGGTVTPSETPVMTVKTEQRTLLRAITKDQYTGRQWIDTSSGKRYLYVNPRWARLRENVFTEKLPTTSIQASTNLLDQKAVSVQIQDTAASTIPTPSYLRKFSAQGSLVAYFNDAGELFATRDLERGDRYTVFTPIVEGGGYELGDLINRARGSFDASYSAILEQYTQLPDHLEKKVYEDLRNIVSNAVTPYEKACAIMRHLQRYYKYSLEVKTPPENQDFVTHFLYVTKKGYCTYFASAMTVLCRMAGLPARYVEGFLAEPNADGFAYITGKSAHAWTEIYFESFGWVPFDPTPDHDTQSDIPPEQDQPQPTPTPTPEPEQDQPDPTPEPPEDDENNPPEQDPDQDQDSEEPHSFPWLILLLGMIAAGALYLLIFLRTPERVAEKAENAQMRLFVYGSAVYELLLLNGIRLRPAETPMQYAARADHQHAAPVQLQSLWNAMCLCFYADLPPQEHHIAAAKDTWQNIWKHQSLWKKIRFRLKETFSRKPYSALNTTLTHTAPVKTFIPKPKNTSGKKR